MSIKAFYQKVVTCNNKECAGFAVHDKKNGYMPRAFQWSSTIPCDILVVSKNPGHPLKQESYKGKDGHQLLNEYMSFRKKVIKVFYNSNDPSARFTRNMRRYLRYFLGIDMELKQYQDYHFMIKDDHELFRRVAFTNLYKCSTKKEPGKIPTDMFENCFNKLFVEELEIYKPKVVLAAGNEVYNFLKHRIKYPIVKVKHFTYFYPKKDEVKILKNLKLNVLKLMKVLDE